MSLRKKLYLSFMVMILLVVCTSAMSMLALWKTDRLVVSARAKSADVSEIMVPANHLIAEIYTDVNQASLFLHAYSFSRLPGDHEEGIKNIGQIRGRIARLDEILKSPRAAGLARSQKDIERSRTELESLAAQAENLHGSMLRSDELQKQIDAELAEVNTLLNDLYDGVIADITAQLTDQAAVGLTPLRERLLKSWGMIDDIYDALAQAEVRFWQGRGKYGEEAAAIFSEVEARLAEQSEKLRALLGSGLITAPEALAKYGALADHLARYASLIKDFSAEWRRSTEFNAALAQASATLLATFDQLEVVNSELSAQNAAEANGSASAVETLVERSIMGALITLIASMVAGAVLAIVITRGIVNPIGAVISSLAHSEAVIGEAAAQLNSTSRDLSEGVTVQASSLDAAASALDQMSAMVKTSAENSKSTDLNTAKTSELVKGGAADMREMSSAMSKINEQADKISNIIKTIEEIAFQTNLLALNASVEAARAGEAGKGFAVVAEEVRNLSARSAQAAKDTTDMITATVTSVRDGSSILDRLSGSYNEIETGIGGIQGLIGQIARALEEQSHGVEQVNIAVSKMNGITRQNAAGAGNSALSAHNLEEQITDLRADVTTLRSIISGQKFGPNAIGAV